MEPGRNVELKARVADAQAVAARAHELADGPPVVIRQTDTFFRCEEGRLKLREQEPGGAELIHYARPDDEGPKTSRYEIIPVPEPAALAGLLGEALGVRAVVRKTRRLLLAGRTRIHLDAVAGLGDFLELEVVLGPGEEEAAGSDEARRLLAALGLGDGDLVAGAYVDLLAAAEA